MARAAVDELLATPIEFKNVADPETGKPIRRLRAGYFHDMWDRAHGLVPPAEMTSEQLATKQKELRFELEKIEAELRKKAALRVLRVRLLAVRALLHK